MIGLTSYRDYFADPASGRSSKFEALCQYVRELEQVLGEPIECVPTRLIGKGGSYDKYDRLLIFEHPTSTMRAIAGFTTANVNMHFVQLEKLVAFKGEFVSYGMENTNAERWIRSMSSRRTNPNTSWHNIPTDDELRDFFRRASQVSYTDALAQHKAARTDFAIGDSHTVMLWRPDRTVRAIYGRTLHRALTEGLHTLVPANAERVTFCFGNIDLRHHLARQADPFEATKELATEYANQVNALACDARVCELLPVIDPARRVSKSYWYKKEPHSGTAEERMALRHLFNGTLESVCDTHTLLHSPSFFEGEDGLLLPEVVEATNGGIHIGPAFYETTAAGQVTKPENAWLP